MLTVDLLPSQVGGSDKREVWVNKRGASWEADEVGGGRLRCTDAPRERVCVCVRARAYLYVCLWCTVTTLT